MQINWFLIVVGIIPYSIKRYRTKNKQVLSVKTLFGRLIISWKKQQHSREIYIRFEAVGRLHRGVEIVACSTRGKGLY